MDAEKNFFLNLLFLIENMAVFPNIFSRLTFMNFYKKNHKWMQ